MMSNKTFKEIKMQFEKAQNHGRALTQDDWKRTQVRMPQDLYSDLMQYAEKNNISLNSAMIELMDKGLETAKTNMSSLVPNNLEQGVLSYYVETQAMLKEMKEAIDRIENKKPTA